MICLYVPNIANLQALGFNLNIHIHIYNYTHIYIILYIYIYLETQKPTKTWDMKKTRGFSTKPDVFKFAVLMVKTEMNRVIHPIPAYSSILGHNPQQTCGWETLGGSSAPS